MKIKGHTPTVGTKSFSAMSADALDSQLRATLEPQYYPPPAHGFTLKRFASANGLGKTAASSAVERLLASGRAKRLGKFRVTDSAGRPQFIEHFALTQPAKK